MTEMITAPKLESTFSSNEENARLHRQVEELQAELITVQAEQDVEIEIERGRKILFNKKEI